MRTISAAANILRGIGVFLLCLGGLRASASTVSTLNSSIASGIAETFNEYAADHEGKLPKSWDDLRPYLDFERMERNIGGPLSSRLMLMGEVHPIIDGDDPPRKMVAMSAYPISDDRRDGNGRYVIILRASGKYASQWNREAAIQKAFANARLSIPPAAVFQEPPIAAYSLENIQKRMLIWFFIIAGSAFILLVLWVSRRRGGLPPKRYPPE